MSLPLISSAANPKIKELQKLSENSRERRSRGLFVVEGARETLRAIASGFEPVTLFICPSLANRVADGLPLEIAFEVTPEVYRKIALRDSTEGVVAIFKAPSRSLSQLVPGANPLIVVMESVEKPGNLGAVLRTADAAGADAVIVCDPLTDLWNPNLIRASLGAAFSVPVVACSSEEACKWLKDNDIQILTAQLQDSSLYYDVDMTRPTAVIMGTEDRGLSDFWRRASDAKIRIPMNGLMDSLNVSVSTAILLYEAVRQRNLK